MDYLLNHSFLIVLVVFIVAGLLCLFTILIIYNNRESREFFIEKNGRSSGENKVPSLGGLGIFAAFSLTLHGLEFLAGIPHHYSLLAAAFVIFLFGVWDDTRKIPAIVKLAGQLIAASIILLDVRITNLHGFLGIYHIPVIESVALSLFVIIVIINSINLIDGIDGLAAGIGLVSISGLGIWFYFIGEYQLACIASIMSGSLIVFLYLNFISSKHKIYLGDSGSLLLGLVIAYLIIQFNELNINISGPYTIYSAPAVSIGILSVPLYDTLRVFFIRIKNGRSPFKPDDSHIHHRLLILMKNHKKVTLLLILVNLFFILVVFKFQYLGTYLLTMLIFFLATILSLIPDFLIRRKKE